MIRTIRCLAPLLVAALFVAAGEPAAAAPTRSLDNELKFLLDQVADALDSDVALKGRTVSLGRISSENRPDSQYGPELRRRFEARLAERLVPDGLLKLTVDYDVVDSRHDVAAGGPGGKPLKVLLVTAMIKDGRKKELFHKSAEINDSADIARVMGFTIAPPANGTQAQRNREIERAHTQNQGRPADQVRPTFQVRNGTRVGIPGSDKFFVEILVKDSPDGPARPLKPVPNAQGNAFVDIRPHQFYEIVIHNHDRHDCVAQIRIDGQDVLNRFNRDGVEYPGLLVGPAQSGTLRGWLHTTRPRTKEKDNVFAFAVREYGHGSASPVANTAHFGVITVQFAVAWKEGDSRPAGRSIGRFTDKGPGLEEKLHVAKRHIGEFNETISIRYSPTAR